MDNIVHAWENIEQTEAELELTDAQLELIYGGCGGSCPFSGSDGESDGSDGNNGWW